MRPVSAAFLSTLTGSHAMASEALVVETFQSTVAPVGTSMSIINGKVKLDGTADIRSTLDLTLDGTRLWPTHTNSLLAPYGNEIFVRRGVQLGAGTTEWCSLGYFRIQSPDQEVPPDGPIRIEGLDRMAGIIDARLLEPRQFMSTETYGDIVTELITEVYPTAVIQWDDATDLNTLDRALIVEEDRHGFLKELITSLGKIWYWDHRGILVILDPPDPTAFVYEVNHGHNGVLVDVSRDLTREGVFNAVVVLGEATDTETPARGVAIDADPTSPTYFYGRFGPVPRFYSSPFITTDAQAQTAAEAILQRELGLPYSISLTAIVNPALEPYDSIRVRYSNVDGAELHVIQDLEVPLIADATMSIGTREQTTTLIGAPA